MDGYLKNKYARKHENIYMETIFILNYYILKLCLIMHAMC